MNYCETYVVFLIPIHASTNAETLVKIGPVVREIFSDITRFLPSHPKMCIYYPRNLWLSGPIFIIFAQNVVNILPLNISFSSEWRYCKPFSNAALPSERIYPNFAIKPVAMATSLEESKKRSRSVILKQIGLPIIWCKDRKNRSSGSWDNLSAFKKEGN